MRNYTERSNYRGRHSILGKSWLGKLAFWAKQRGSSHGPPRNMKGRLFLQTHDWGQEVSWLTSYHTLIHFLLKRPPCSAWLIHTPESWEVWQPRGMSGSRDGPSLLSSAAPAPPPHWPPSAWCSTPAAHTSLPSGVRMLSEAVHMFEFV